MQIVALSLPCVVEVVLCAVDVRPSADVGGLTAGFGCLSAGISDQGFVLER